MRIRAALFALAALALGSCATLSEDACRQGDWRGIGLADGAAGRSARYIEGHAKACAEIGVAPDVAAWREGRSQGLPRYCTPDNAFRAGLRGGRLNPVCQGFDEYRLDRANARGLREYRIERETRAVERDIYELDARIDTLLDDDIGDEDRRLIRAYRREINRSERLLRLLALESRTTFLFP